MYTSWLPHINSCFHVAYVSMYSSLPRSLQGVQFPSHKWSLWFCLPNAVFYLYEEVFHKRHKFQGYQWTLY